MFAPLCLIDELANEIIICTESLFKQISKDEKTWKYVQNTSIFIISRKP